MALRTCCYPPCGKIFAPEKPSYWWCCYDHYLFDKERRGQPLYDSGYRDGYAAGYQQGLAEGQTQISIPPELWRSMVKLSHPDFYQNSPLLCAATTVTQWLTAHRPKAGEAST